MMPLVVVAAASLLAVGAINSRRATQETQASIDRQLQGVVRVLKSSNFPLDRRGAASNEGSFWRGICFDKSGRFAYFQKYFPRSVQLPRTPLANTTEEVALGPQISLGDKAYFHSAVGLKRPLGESASGVLHVLFPRRQYDAAWRSAFLPPLVIGMFAVLAVALVTQWIAGRISSNLAHLGRRAATCGW